MTVSAKRFSSLEMLSAFAAEIIYIDILGALSEKKECSVVLSGGSTPRLLYEYLGSPPYQTAVPWQNVHLFWGDERFVPREHESSNYRLVEESLLSGITIPPDNIHPVNTMGEGPRKAAADYDNTLKSFFNEPGMKDAGSAHFDLVLLGVGSDGHTASLFPGDPVMEDKNDLARAVTAPSQYTIRPRITMTPTALCGAHRIYFLVSGSEKLPLAEKIIHNPFKLRTVYPAAYVTANTGKAIWLINE